MKTLYRITVSTNNECEIDTQLESFDCMVQGEFVKYFTIDPYFTVRTFYKTALDHVNRCELSRDYPLLSVYTLDADKIQKYKNDMIDIIRGTLYTRIRKYTGLLEMISKKKED